MSRIRTVFTGAGYPTSIWTAYMTMALEGEPIEEFPPRPRHDTEPDTDAIGHPDTDDDVSHSEAFTVHDVAQADTDQDDDITVTE